MIAIYSADYVQKMINALKENEALEECVIISAYPYAMKPAKLSVPVIAVSPSGFKAESTAVGQSFYTGLRSISVEAFVPRPLGSPCAYSILEAVARTAEESGVESVTAGKIKVNNEIECFSAECVLSFFSEMNFTEDSNG